MRQEVQHQGGERPEDDGAPEEDAQNRSSAECEFCLCFKSLLSCRFVKMFFFV